jgi:hypothetical protein
MVFLRQTFDTAAHDSLLDYEAHMFPAAPTLVRFRDRGVWYEIPKSHLKKPLHGLHPVDAAPLALEFYKGFIKEAEFRFAERRPAKSVTADDRASPVIADICALLLSALCSEVTSRGALVVSKCPSKRHFGSDRCRLDAAFLSFVQPSAALYPEETSSQSKA